ncbi:pseudouridine synthase [Agarilytica rhodophyticola]|uniref:pseudouridine synthase n=1 Tax=Agarilytica rhodophyticola TaxID=1737490 RepID=UPI000B346A57|nr:pseudouridine synthase [Agarilytica rhodophyticola]
MATIVLINKPYHMLCQFTDKDNRPTLADIKTLHKFNNFYPAGRLDFDSEGLIVLTNNGALQHHISHPDHKLSKTYWVQVEGAVDKGALAKLSRGIELKDGLTKPAKAKAISLPKLWDRYPPIRERQNIPTSWLELTINEGKNRQVRRMTAAVGYPTLRLIRARIGSWALNGLQPGEIRVEQAHLPRSSNSTKSNSRNKRSRAQR